MALYEEESKKARIFQREKRQELQLIIERCNKIQFEYICIPLERNVGVAFGTSLTRKIHQIANDKSVNSYERRCFNEFFEESPRKLDLSSQAPATEEEIKPSVPFSSKVSRFQDLTLLDSSQGYRKRKKVQEVFPVKKAQSAPFGSKCKRDLKISNNMNKSIVPSPLFKLIIDEPAKVNHSFGGKTSRPPAYEIVCSPLNKDSKCSSCEGEAKNIYWKNNNGQIIYCRQCYKNQVQKVKNKTKNVLDRYKKLQDLEKNFKKKCHCDFLHEHNNVTAAVSKIPQKELEKRLRKESFLSIYFKY